jgi:hypothetical protein
LLVRDVNADGLADIVTTARDESDNGQLLVWLNSDLSEGIEGLGLSASAFEMEAPWTEIRSIDFGDTNGDFFGDVLIGSRDGRLIVARGAGDGTFAPAETNTSAQLVGGGALRVGELNGDGRLDVANASRVADSSIDQAFVRSLIGEGDGTFQVQTIGGLSSTGPENALRPLIGDLNNDGAEDLVLIHGTANSISVLLNQLSRFEPYGIGKAGSEGLIPQLRGRGYTTPGGQIEIIAEDVLGGTVGLFLVGVGRVDDQFLAMQTIVAQVLVFFDGEPGVPGDGGLNLPFTLPETSEIVGADVALQMLILDPGAGGDPFDLAFSNGLGLLIVQ